MIQFELVDADRALFENAVRFARKQVRALMEIHPDYYPLYTHDGRWKHEGQAWTHWCDGFLPGMMWIFHRHLDAGSEDAKFWRERAIHYSTPLEDRKFDRDVHDLGFIFLSTYYRWYRLDKDPKLNDVLIQAGRT
ncbi:MAG: glucuronyl hydrolase, partial [bacterium]|nr:glucuronyl hydrolase [bacterium]